MLRHIFIAFLLSLFAILNLHGQDNYFVISQTLFEGNKKTKTSIIERELDFRAGDTIFVEDLSQVITENEKRILNTGLFTNVTLNIKEWDTEGKTAMVHITLLENWYIYPAPIFELADRNFNVWWNDQNRSLERVNYGARLSHINLTGNRDKLKFIFQRGYTKKYELDYRYPYLNEAQTLGGGFNIFYTENKEIGYITSGNKTTFYKDEENERVLLNRFRVRFKLDFRPDLFQYHKFSLEFHRNSIDEFIAKELNPDYFLNEAKSLRFVKLNYEFRYDKRIFNLYPEGGFLVGINIDKSGLGIFKEYNNLSTFVFYEKFFKPHERVIFALSAKAKTNLNKEKLAFANNTALGYGSDLVGGYELYVMDGSDFFLGKSSLRLKMLDRIFNLGKTMPVGAFKYFGLQCYLTFNFDSAIVNERTYKTGNDLNNKWVFGYGPGLDFILYNNYLFQIEYSFNQLGEKGVYIHNQISF